MEEISSPPYKYASVCERDDRISRVGSSVNLTTAINIALYKDFPATNKDAINARAKRAVSITELANMCDQFITINVDKPNVHLFMQLVKTYDADLKALKYENKNFT